MRMLCKKLLSGLLALTLALSLAPAALAEGTRLKVELYGLYAQQDGSYQSVAVSGVFDVYQGNVKLGTVSVAPDADSTITLPGAEVVRLAPVAGSYPEELELNAYGYGVAITEGRLNIAPISVYAKAAPAATTTPAPTAEPVETPAPTPEATAAPTEEPAPTAAPTVTPAPTMAPTASPEPTAEPTPVPTPATGSLALRATGEGVTVSCTVMTTSGANVAKGTLSDGCNAVTSGLQPGEYFITLHLPERIVLTALNGNPVVQRGTVQWRAAVNAGQESCYDVELTGTGSLSVPLENVTGAKVYVTGERESFEVTANAKGEFVRAYVLPDVYDVKVQLPAGRYDYDDYHHCWTLTENADGTCTATMSFGVNRNCETELPPITRITIGSASGVVKDIDGDALNGVAVTIYDANGQVAATAKTDKKGAWAVESLTYGEYIAQYSDDDRAIPATSFTLDDANVDAKLSASAAAPAKITVRAFIDENNNGSWGRNEDFLKDVEVSLVDENGAVVDTGLTGRDGYVTLSAPEGKYRLRAHAPQDYGFGMRGGDLSFTESIMQESASRTQESDYIMLSGSKKREAGIGLMPMAVVRGTVWNDLNADGVWQEEEPGIPGIRLTLEGGKERISVEGETDENGVYVFRQIKKGTYKLICHVPDAYVFTVKAKGDEEKISRMTTEKERAGEDQIKLERGEVHENHNIGMMDGAIIEGVCFLDANYNGRYDEGEQPLPGVEMRLARQSNNVMLQHTVSGEDGSYHFVGQRGSTFTVRANLPKGYVFSVVADGENGNQFAPNGDKEERRLTDIALENGGYRKIMLGAVQFGSISGRVYYDGNFSSAWEKGERLGIGYYVFLYDVDGNRVGREQSDKNGLFTFEKLLPGDYTITMTPEKGYAFTALGSANVMQTMSDGIGSSRIITVEMGENVTDAGAGMIVPAVVSGVVFADDNDNGLQDQNEKGLQGAKVRLMNEKGVVAEAMVGQSGGLCFNAVLPGNYYLQYELPEHGVFAAVVENGNTMTGENRIATGEWFSVNSGDTWNAPLCGGLLLSGISGTAFADSNGSSVKDAQEGPMAGMVITLTPSRSDLQEITVTTGADGKFAISDLRPDTYTLTVQCPEEYVLSRMTGVSMPLTNGLAKQEKMLQLKMGTQWHDQMLGCVIPASWTGEAWLDENYDGLRSADETAAAGETMELRDANSGETVSAVQTDENGVFVINGIAPGEYELVYPLDEGNLLPRDGSCDFVKQGSALTNGRVTIHENEKKSGTELCVVRTTEVGGLVWLEQHDGVTPVQNATLHLLDAQGKALAEYTTGVDGRYVFKGLMPGRYALDVTIPEGYLLVEGDDLHLADTGLTSFVEDIQGVFGQSVVFEVKMARHLLNVDAGMVLPGRLGDKAWLDLNGNGLQDGEEGGIPGVTVELMRGDQVVASAVTDQYGYYAFENLYPTVYILRVTWPVEVKPTVLREDIKQISSILQENGMTIPVTVPSNKANYAADLGFVLIDEDKLPAGYGEGATQVWKKK